MKKIKITFWAVIIMFSVILIQFFVPPITELFRGKIFLFPIAIFSLLGIILTFFVIKNKMERKFKLFLLMTGISSAGFFVCVVLHNLFYALWVLTEDIIILHSLMEILHIIFFFVAHIVCPIGFLIGIVGSIVQMNE